MKGIGDAPDDMLSFSLRLVTIRRYWKVEVGNFPLKILYLWIAFSKIHCVILSHSNLLLLISCYVQNILA